MAEFTKGPWSVDAFTKGVFALNVPDDGGDIICSEPEGYASASRWHANAILIAAAPDLYEALNALLGADDKITVAIGGNPIYVEKLMARARSALARAEGKGGT